MGLPFRLEGKRGIDLAEQKVGESILIGRGKMNERNLRQWIAKLQLGEWGLVGNSISIMTELDTCNQNATKIAYSFITTHLALTQPYVSS